MGPVLNEGDGTRFTVAVGRKAVGAGGLEIRRFSFKRFASLSFCGDGESSMMRTHPDESPILLFVFFWLSLLSSRESTLFLWDSQLVFAVEEFDATEEAELIPVVGVEKPETELGLPVILGILRRGTRVCIFCSKLRTLARISETIWTPLFLAIDPADEVLMVDGLRTTGGRTSPRGLSADGLAVLDRMVLEEFFKAVSGLALSWKPVRRMKVEGRAERDKDAFGVVLISGARFSKDGDMSAKSRSGGG